MASLLERGGLGEPGDPRTQQHIQLFNKLQPTGFLIPGQGSEGEVGLGDFINWHLANRNQKAAFPSDASASNPLIAANNARLPTTDQTASFPSGASGADPLAKLSQVTAAIAAAVAITPAYLPAVPSGITAPTKLFWFDGDKTEQIDGDDLSLVGGTEEYRPFSFNAGPLAGWFDGSTHYSYSGANIATYRNTGEMSAVVFGMLTQPGTDQGLFSVAGLSTNDAVDNHLSSLIYRASSGKLEYFSENGSGTNSQLLSSTALPMGRFVAGFSRNAAGTTVTLYVNGAANGTSSSLTQPDGGSSAILRIGADAGGTLPWLSGFIGGVAFLFGDSWDASEHQAIAQMILPYLA